MEHRLRYGDATRLSNAAWAQGQQRPSAGSTRNGAAATGLLMPPLFVNSTQS